MPLLHPLRCSFREQEVVVVGNSCAPCCMSSNEMRMWSGMERGVGVGAFHFWTQSGGRGQMVALTLLPPPAYTWSTDASALGYSCASGCSVLGDAAGMLSQTPADHDPTSAG